MNEVQSSEAAVGTPLYTRPEPWLIGLVALLGAALYGPLFVAPSRLTVAAQSAEFFFEPNEAAGVPVLVLTAWLFYRRSHYLDVLDGNGRVGLGALVLVAAAFVFGWGEYTAAEDLQLFSVIPVLFGLALMLGGFAAVRAFWVPILFLGFALPVPPVLLSAALFPIQLVTADLAGVILNAIGVQSLVVGDQILRPENTFIVIETCSGVRSIVTLTMLTVLLIDLFERTGWHAASLMILAPIVAFASNGMRVVTLVLNPHSQVHSIHNLQGIAMLLVGLTGMYALDVLLERTLPRGADAAEDHAGRTDDSTAPRGGGRTPPSTAGRRAALAVVGVVLLSFVGMTATIAPFAVPRGLDERPRDMLERLFGQAMSDEIPLDYKYRGSLRYLDYTHRYVRFEGQQMEVFLGVANEGDRPFTMLSKRTAWPSSGWAPVSEAWVEGPGTDDPVRRMTFKRGVRQGLSYSAHLRAGGLVGEWVRNQAALDRSPWHRDQHMISLRISTQIGRGERGEAEAEERVRRLWQRLAAELDGYAPFGGSGT